MPNFVMDYLQRLSSTVTPPEGCPVGAMDELISRELDQRILDESKYPPTPTQPGLIARLFPDLAFLDQDDLITTRNRNHREVRMPFSATMSAVVGLQKVQKLHSTPATMRNLRPRARLTGGGGKEIPKVGRRGKGRGKRTARKVKPRKQRGEKVESDEDDTSDDDSAEVLYDIRKKEWNLEAASGGVALVNEAFIDQVEQLITDHFTKPRAPTVIKDSDGNHIAGPHVDGLVPDSENPITTASHRPAASSQLPLVNATRCPSVSPELIDTNSEESSAFGSCGIPHQGAAFNGNSSRDQDYFQGKKHEKMAKVHTMESHRAAFMNAL
jgi:hypothetical protein